MDFAEGRELKLERQVGGVIKYIDQQYADTMSEVTRLYLLYPWLLLIGLSRSRRSSVRVKEINTFICEWSRIPHTDVTDNSIRCIYLIDPASIVTRAERRTLSSFPTKTQSEATVSPTQDSPREGEEASDRASEDDERLTMSPTELRIIRRIATKANVLPVIARADSLTDEKLEAVKEAGMLPVLHVSSRYVY